MSNDLMPKGSSVKYLDFGLNLNFGVWHLTLMQQRLDLFEKSPRYDVFLDLL